MDTTGTHLDRTTARLGFWSAIGSATFAVLYIVAEIAHHLGLLGPYDNPASLVMRMTPSLLLPLAFVVLISVVHTCAPAHRKIWSQIALAFTVIYAVLVTLVYYVELSVVVPKALRGEADAVALLAFGHGTFLFAVDILGYGFMSLATLFAAPVFEGPGLERWIRRALFLNGCLAPAIVLQIFYAPLFFVAGLWLVTFPAAMLMMGVWFRRTA